MPGRTQQLTSESFAGWMQREQASKTEQLAVVKGLAVPTIALIGPERRISPSSLIEFVRRVGGVPLNGIHVGQAIHIGLKRQGLIETVTGRQDGEWVNHFAVNYENEEAATLAAAETVRLVGGREIGRPLLASLVEDQVALDAADRALELRFREFDR